MDVEKVLAALNNPVRRQILNWLKDRSNFPPALPEHAELEGVCVAYIQDKAKSVPIDNLELHGIAETGGARELQSGTVSGLFTVVTRKPLNSF